MSKSLIVIGGGVLNLVVISLVLLSIPKNPSTRSTMNFLAGTSPEYLCGIFKPEASDKFFIVAHDRIF